jgi:septal ring factor EnvC (AmiA/AmiB activator)
MRTILLTLAVLTVCAIAIAQEYKVVGNELEKTVTSVIVTKQSVDQIQSDISGIDNNIARAEQERAKYQAILADIENTISQLQAARAEKEAEILKVKDWTNLKT